MKKDNNPLEKVIERNVCLYAKDKYAMMAYKFTSPARASVPDRLFVTKNGVVFFIEFKRKGKIPTSGQQREITRLLQSNAGVFVIDNIEEGRKLIDVISGIDNLNELSSLAKMLYTGGDGK